jgi:electron transfer flavoprotein alpha subunit
MLAVIPVRDGVLPAGGAEVAAECAGRVLLIGSGTALAALELTGVSSVVRIAEVGGYAPGAWARSLAPHLVAEAFVALPHSPDGRDLAPRLAHAMGRPLHAGAISIQPSRVQVARHGGSMIADIRPHGPFVATLQPGVRGVEMHPGAAAPAVETMDLADNSSVPDVRVVEVLPPDVTTMDLAEAPRILGGGAGLADAEAFERLSRVSAALGASMGATRVITDRGWVGHSRQIGTTGVVVDPRVYIAFGISGAVQHTSGLGNPAHIISVNTDAHCPMMQLADLAVVSDANAVLVELEARLTALENQERSA